MNEGKLCKIDSIKFAFGGGRCFVCAGVGQLMTARPSMLGEEPQDDGNGTQQATECKKECNTHF